MKHNETPTRLKEEQRNYAEINKFSEEHCFSNKDFHDRVGSSTQGINDQKELMLVFTGNYRS